jgi:predicted ester cyclase
MKKISWLLIIVSVLAVLPVRSDSSVIAQDGDSVEANKAVLLAFFEAEAAREYGRMDEFFVEDFVRHSVATTAVMPEVQVTSREQYVQFLQGMAAGFPDYRTTPEILVAEGDYVAFYAIWTGTFAQNGNATGGPMVGCVRFEGGKMAEMWIEWDSLTWSQQMGTPDQADEALARRLFEELWLKRNPDVIDEIFAENAVWCMAATDSCGAITSRFRKDWVSEFLAAFPDLDATLIRVAASDDTVTLEWQGTGTFSSAFAEMLTGELLAPTNKVEEWSVLWIGTFEDGKVIREHWYWTWYGWPVAPPN